MFADGEGAVVPDQEELEEGISDSVGEEPEQTAKEDGDDGDVQLEHLIVFLVFEPANIEHHL